MPDTAHGATPDTPHDTPHDTPPQAPPDAPLWDLLCHVVDNYGDAGVCLRLARELGARGQRVRLWLSEPTLLPWMAPQGLGPRVQVAPWPAPTAWPAPGDAVVEAFGCATPQAWVDAMTQRAAVGRAPVWINLEYLSAEPYVARSHGLPSPQPGGLTRWFFYPGFTPGTGGLLRGADTPIRQPAQARRAWLAAQGWTLAPGERAVSLFCYPHAPLDALMRTLAAQPTCLLLAAGASQAPALAAVQALAHPHLRALALPLLAQSEFDALLAAADVAVVRGEDSLTRALLAGTPLLWHIYPQDDGAHGPKLNALLHTLHAPAAVAALWRQFNGLAPPAAGPAGHTPPWPDATAWAAHARAAQAALLAQQDLVTQLLAFAASRSQAS